MKIKNNNYNLSFEIIEFEEWRKSILPMWPWNQSHYWIPIINNPYGMIQYLGREVFERTLVFPIAAKVNNRSVGWCLVYNISDTVVRVRGVYVDPEFRGNRIAQKLYDYALSIWPEPWTHYVGYYDPKSFELFQSTWNLKPIKEYLWRTRQIPGQDNNKNSKIKLGRRNISLTEET